MKPKKVFEAIGFNEFLNIVLSNFFNNQVFGSKTLVLSSITIQWWNGILSYIKSM